VLVCVLQISTKTIPGRESSTEIFFGIAAALCALCIAVQIMVVEHNPVMRAARANAKQTTGSDPTEEEMKIVASPEDGSYGSIDKIATETLPADDQLSTFEVLECSWKCLLSVFLTFYVTLLLFPGVTSEMRTDSVSSSWWPLLLMTIFNVCDLAGRGLASTPVLQIPVSAVLGSSVLRLALAPLFVICVRPSVIKEAWMQGLLVGVLGISNGWLGTLGMMYGPNSVTASNKAKVGLMTVFFLTLGLTAGSWSGVGVKLLIDHAGL